MLYGNAVANWLNGGDGTDLVSGLGGHDILVGGAGADRLFGGAGIDLAYYAESSAAVTVSLNSGVCRGGDAEGDTLSGIEDLEGSSFNDVLYGDGGANWLYGSDGDDLVGGLDGDDTLHGGKGADRLIGGAGIDTAVYIDSSAGVTVSLTTRAGSGGDAQGDLIEAENVKGSGFADAIYGDAGANLLDGRAGRDVLEGRGGADSFVISNLADSASGANADRITDFSHAQGDRLDLSAIDAGSTAPGDQAFRFIGTAAYSFRAGELHYAFSGSTTIIGGDVNGDGVSDFNIVLTGKVMLVAEDFVL